ncbi:substrate-binding domain-containing protein [Pseudomonas paraversuta]|jgi:DNA-binding LacI/PurR family transcriptional regulator|uniref:substrate-binding domain-containing protein n=1 Tax=Pseudomonas TaxID=286 RepID=UPI0002882797|nr:MULTISPECIES: substrate-binding domain-containing protein [Pseudomonas]AMB80560.1 LacI family transcriptional regulator [Pseudomonas fragi]NBF16603.1 substrate-binding domain-containing protein [Pseudomonas sp. Fl4BN2]NNG60721.1 substrate-binding domain-containing protein [Pseudomonas sp. GC01]AUB76292.1 LacI family transcriptional regulator [Pseudomonas sp. Lz4W]NBG93535.1 LacI family DNA-binding transcriptional regulator [Pseudomonas sp. 9.1(2019)]
MPSSSSRRPTIADVASAAGVSRTTVSHALNDRGQVDPQTRTLVKEVAARLGYSPNLRAQRLRTGRANSIALLSSMPFAVAGGSSRLGFLMEIAATAMEAALRQGVALVLVPPMEGAQDLLDTLDIDGAIIIEPVANDPHIARLRKRGVKLISIGRQPETDDPVPYIDMHADVAGALLLEHLHAQGARRTGLIIGAQSRHSYVDMEHAYRAYCASTDQPVAIVRADEAGGESAGAEACLQLLEEYPQLDSLCVPVDAFATGAVQALTARGLKVPQDVKVVTRYNGLRARECNPPLTAVNMHLEQIAAQAIELLFEQINNTGQRQRMDAPLVTLVVRDSSAQSDGPARH